jgi:hypothetical protein
MIEKCIVKVDMFYVPQWQYYYYHLKSEIMYFNYLITLTFSP